MNTKLEMKDENVLFHTRMQNILSDTDITDKDKSANVIALITELTTNVANLQFNDKNTFDNYIEKNLGPEMKSIVRKIGNNGALVHDDQIFQLVSILTTLHVSATANMLISYDMFR